MLVKGRLTDLIVLLDVTDFWHLYLDVYELVISAKCYKGDLRNRAIELPNCITRICIIKCFTCLKDA